MKPKTKTCEICGELVSLLAARIQYPTRVEHVSCRSEQEFNRGVKIGREAMLTEQKDAREAEVSKTISDAVRQFNDATRCLKCGIPMLAERPPALPSAFQTITPGSGTGATCSACVKAEVQARNAVRQAALPSTSFQANRPPEISTPQEPSNLQPGGRPIEID